jgi:hypothetical protein
MILNIDSLDEGTINCGGFIVKSRTLDVEFWKLLLEEVSTIRSAGNFQPAKVGSYSSTMNTPIFRGDMICWVTPRICRDLQLRAMQQLVQSFIKAVKPIKGAFELVDDYSVQLGLYVSCLLAHV